MRSSLLPPVKPTDTTHPQPPTGVAYVQQLKRDAGGWSEGGWCKAMIRCDERNGKRMNN